MAYRIAVIYARSVLVGIAGVANWFYGFGAGALTMMMFLLLHHFLLPRFEMEKTIWPLTLLMNINILAYLVLSEGRPLPSETLGVSSSGCR